ncbi:hypothetical protein MASR1M107_30000 [Ignavibacteriales bacterium]
MLICIEKESISTEFVQKIFYFDISRNLGRSFKSSKNGVFLIICRFVLEGALENIIILHQ